jgi:hypothetical protein
MKTRKFQPIDLALMLPAIGSLLFVIITQSKQL